MISVDRTAFVAEVEAIVRRVLGEMFQGDRRAQPRAAAGAKRAKRCPVNGCGNPFATRFGGYCKDHRDTAGFKAWQRANAAKAKGAKKR